MELDEKKYEAQHYDVSFAKRASSCNTKSEEDFSNLEMQSTTELTSHNDSDLIEPCGGPVGVYLMILRNRLTAMLNVSDSKLSTIKRLALAVLLAAYAIYVAFRWIYSDCERIDWSNGYGLLFILYALLLLHLIYRLGFNRLFKAIINNLPYSLKTIKIGVWWSFNCILGVAVILFFVLTIKDAVNESRRFLSLGGYFGLLLLGFLFSKHPEYVRWDTIARGVSLHMIMAVVIVKWRPGRDFLTVFSNKIIDFLDYSYVGARFIYGDFLIDMGIFLFKSLSVLFFLAMIINVLFYYGILQSMFHNLGRVMQFLLGTTIIESSNAVATVFLGMSESPLLFKPYLTDLTPSEIHAIMAGGFATVAGTVLAAYVSLGADPTTLVSASAMAAPASLTFSKLFYPESRNTKTSSNNIVIHKSEDSNVVDAACKGAMIGCELVPAIAANVLACVSLVACFNGLLSWLGMLAGIPNLSFEGLVGLIFVPLAWLMGVSQPEITDVAKLIGIKTVINEFIGYKELGVLKKANKLTVRSETIATFAMCGFANPGSVAILVSSLITVCPAKRKVITEVALRSFIAGSCSSFLSAALAGYLTPENGFVTNEMSNNHSLYNDTSCYYFSW